MTHSPIRHPSTLLLSLALLAGAALAQTPAGHEGHHGAAASAPAAPPATEAGAAPATGAAWAQAEVRRVDTRAGKVTLKHGDIPNLGMPPMTMVFQVQDPALLSQVKAGDKVRFTADQINGAYTVLQIEAAP